MLTSFLQILALPLLVSGSLLLLEWRPWKSREISWERSWSIPLALALSFLLSFAWILGVPRLPPTDAIHWLFWLVLAVAAVAPHLKSQSLPETLRLFAPLLPLAAEPFLLLRPLMQNSWSGTEGALYTGGATLVLLGMGAGITLLAKKNPGPGAPVGLLGILGAGALAVGLSGSASLAELAGALAVALAPVVFLSWRAGGFVLPVGAAAVFSVVFGGTVLAGHFYAGLAGPETLLLLSAPLVPWLGEIPRLKEAAGPRGWVLQALLAAAPAGAAVGIALARFLKAAGESAPY